LGLAAITGGRWRTPRNMFRDVAIAVPFWVVWELTALAFHRALGPSAAKTVDNLLPQGIAEGALWIAVSISAGICEEFAFRGYLQRQILGITGSVALAVAGQAAVFAAAHAYQGWKNVVVIFALGALYGALAAWRRSLIPGMLAHAWSDIYEGYVKFLL
jgi:membrane protease YdiL (CAAX protease family)